MCSRQINQELLKGVLLLAFTLPALRGLPEAGWLNKSSRLAAALGVTKFMTAIAMNLVTLCCGTTSAVIRCSMNPPLTP